MLLHGDLTFFFFFLKKRKKRSHLKLFLWCLKVAIESARTSFPFASLPPADRENCHQPLPLADFEPDEGVHDADSHYAQQRHDGDGQRREACGSVVRQAGQSGIRHTGCFADHGHRGHQEGQSPAAHHSAHRFGQRGMTAISERAAQRQHSSRTGGKMGK